MPSALSDVRVVELAHIMAGPVCGLLLGDMGADVVKVERLPKGDGTRGFVPPEIGGESAAFMMLNRGKKGIAVDLRSEEGRTIVRRLTRTADVLVENFRVGTMERLGLGYDLLAELNPRLVYCQITGFGRTGPLAEQGGFDLIAQGYSGLMSITGEGSGGSPVKVGPPITDITAGILAAFGVVCALVERERTGAGQRVDTSLMEAGISQTYWQSAIALASGVSPGAMGTAHPLAAPYQSFRTSDGWINVGASNESTWHRLTEAVEMPGMRDDPRFASNAQRMKNLDDLVSVLSPVFRARAADEWLIRLQSHGVPAGPVASIGEMLEHPQTLAREMVIDVTHPSGGTTCSLGTPVKMSGSRARETRGNVDGVDQTRPGAPRLGEHTLRVLEELGYSEAELTRLLESRVVAGE